MATTRNSGNRANRSNSIKSFNRMLNMMLFLILSFTLDLATASQDVLPHPCDTVKCPHMLNITCPDDSDIRESILPIGFLHAITPMTTNGAYNTSEIAQDLYAQCCLAKKCICKTCYIPDCHKPEEVVIELQPESMDTPGHCCGQYECRKEPNCTEVRDTEGYWLTDCQRCKCYSGERICHQNCDEGGKTSAAMCSSKNRFYENGESWQDGCYECECVFGEVKCITPFCKSVNCPHKKVPQGSCCPLCWPYEDYNEDGENINAADKYGPHAYDEDDDEPLAPLSPPTNNDYAGNEIDTLPNINFESNTNEKVSKSTIVSNASSNISTTSAATTSTTTTTTTTTPATSRAESSIKPTITPLLSTATSFSTVAVPPCAENTRGHSPATYQLYPEVVEVVRQTRQNDLLYGIIGCLALLVVILTAWNIHLRAKQRSYRPVSNFDDNFNKLSNIKKMNDYV